MGRESLMVSIVAQLCLLRLAYSKRVTTPFEGSESPSLEIAPTQGLLANGQSIPRDDEIPSCRRDPFSRPSKTYRFDADTENTSIAVELQRATNPKSLILKIHKHQMWQITLQANSKEPVWELTAAPDTEKPEHLTFDLMRDNITIEGYTFKNKEQADEFGIRFNFESRKSFKKRRAKKIDTLAFVGGSYYPPWMVKKALQTARTYAAEKITPSVGIGVSGLSVRQARQTADNADVAMTPAMKGSKVFFAGFALSIPTFMAAVTLLHSAAYLYFPISAPIMSMNLALGGAAGLHKYAQMSRRKRSARISAAEKMLDVIWCVQKYV